MPNRRPRRVVWILLACAIVGLATFGLMVRSVTSTDRITLADATRRFEAQRIGSGQPLLELAPDGSVIRRKPSPTSAPTALERVNVWVYRIATQRFIETRIPFWFFRLKAPAAQYALGGTGLDFDTLGITPEVLSRYGPGLVIDWMTPDGRVLIWTE